MEHIAKAAMTLPDQLIYLATEIMIAIANQGRLKICHTSLRCCETLGEGVAFGFIIDPAHPHAEIINKSIAVVALGGNFTSQFLFE